MLPVRGGQWRPLVPGPGWLACEIGCVKGLRGVGLRRGTGAKADMSYQLEGSDVVFIKSQRLHDVLKGQEGDESFFPMVLQVLEGLVEALAGAKRDWSKSVRDSEMIRVLRVIERRTGEEARPT
jgi:hypothetical protein